MCIHDDGRFLSGTRAVVPTVRGLPTLAMLGACVALALPATAGAQDDSNWSLHGYARTWASMNLKDIPETAEDDKHDFSMLRGALSLQADYSNGPWSAKVVARADGEDRTSYQKRLQALADVNAGGAAHDISDSNHYNRVDLREWYVDYTPNTRFSMRLGKQQVVWGESDFFQAMDIVSGYDYRWRLFLEPEGDELRKPLIQGSFTFTLPGEKTSFQLLIRPGWDRKRDIGNDYDLFAGRWGVQPYRGVDFGMLVAQGYDHPESEYDAVTGGLRFRQMTDNGWDYTLSYLRTHFADPVFSPSQNPYGGRNANGGILADSIHPLVDAFGFTANRYFEAVDGVFSTEQVYIPNAPYNWGTDYTSCVLLANCGAEDAGNHTGLTPGLAGVAEKDTLISMIRLDKMLRLENVLGTSVPSLFSMQLFNKHIFSYNRSDELVDFAMFGAPKHKDTTIFTTFIALGYRQERIKPGLAVAWDITNGGSFAIPSIEFAYGDHWRLRLEVDLFFPSHEKQPGFGGLGTPEGKTHLVGWWANSNQLLARLTYQF